MYVLSSRILLMILLSNSSEGASLVGSELPKFLTTATTVVPLSSRLPTDLTSTVLIVLACLFFDCRNLIRTSRSNRLMSGANGPCHI